MPTYADAVIAAVVVAELFVVYRASRVLQGRMLVAASRGRRMRWLVGCLLAPGTALHECSHALAALILGATVHRFVPFRGVGRRDAPHLLGYVELALRRDSRIAAATIGIAPLWLGTPLLYALVDLCAAGGSVAEWVQMAGRDPIRAVVGVAVLALGSLGIVPSPSDHKDAWVLVPFALVAAAACVAGGIISDVILGMSVVMAWPALILGAMSAPRRLPGRRLRRRDGPIGS